MTPFVGEFRGETCVVVAFVWAIDHLKAVVIRKDRSIHWLRADDVTLTGTTMEMPNIFDWPEPAAA